MTLPKEISIEKIEIKIADKYHFVRVVYTDGGGMDIGEGALKEYLNIKRIDREYSRHLYFLEEQRNKRAKCYEPCG